MGTQLLLDLAEIYQKLPPPVLGGLILILGDSGPLERKSEFILTNYGSSNVVRQLVRMIEEKQTSPEEILLVFDSFKAYDILKPQSQISLVWSGPNLHGVPMRMTAQVIIDLIDNATTELFLSSFSFYNVKEIVDHLSIAINRGVSLSLLLETPQSSHYKIKNDPIAQLDRELINKAKIYIWPYKNRILEGDNQTGSLHAKFILQDKDKLFISSANLTQSALDRNIELGVIIGCHDVVEKFQDHLANLISENIIIRL